MDKRTFFPSLILVSSILLSSCTITIPSESFEGKVATQASVVFTATALAEYFSKPTETTEPPGSPTSESIPEPSATLSGEDPVKSLVQPNWKDDLSTSKNWNLDSGNVTFGNTTFSHVNGKLQTTGNSTSEGYIWYLSYLKLKNAYVEAKFDVGACSGKDQYGIVFRAVNYTDGFAYYFSVTCDGNYNLRRWNSSGSTLIIENKFNSAINSGGNKTNVMGIWAKDSRIRLYANGQFLEEINNSDLTGEGHFGLFINAKETPGFTFAMDEIAYWLVN